MREVEGCLRGWVVVVVVIFGVGVGDCGDGVVCCDVLDMMVGVFVKLKCVVGFVYYFVWVVDLGMFGWVIIIGGVCIVGVCDCGDGLIGCGR